jgi:alpha-tubulin suppressor-like RCC1 family protein
MPTPAPTPTPTPTPEAVHPANTAIAAGYRHSCALTSGGGVTCWGSNAEGELGNGTINEVAVSGTVDVSGLSSGVSAIAAGGFHTCALTSDGGVKCWGDNLYRQLGNGTNADSSTPVDVSGLSTGVKAITVGWSHSCALTSSGGVKCWGNNPFGGLGDGTRTDRNVPVDVSGLASGISAIAAGGLHTCALTTSGGVTCWGEGSSDDPRLAWSTVPVDAPDLTRGIMAIAAGTDQTCALTMQGGSRAGAPTSPPLRAGICR